MSLDANNITDLAAIISQVEATRNRAELFDVIKTYFNGYGFEHIGLGIIQNPAEVGDLNDNIAFSNFPEEYTRTWVENRYIMHDPVTRFGARARSVYFWKQAYEYASNFGRRVYDSGSEFNLTNGVGIPVTVPDFAAGLFSMSHSNPDFSKDLLLQFELVGIHAYSHFLSLTGAAPISREYELTPRETEVMHFVAGGKTNWEIGMILGVSEDTVKKNMKNINSKMNTVNRAHSVSTAIQSGDIIL